MGSGWEQGAGPPCLASRESGQWRWDGQVAAEEPWRRGWEGAHGDREGEGGLRSAQEVRDGDSRNLQVPGFPVEAGDSGVLWVARVRPAPARPASPLRACREAGQRGAGPSLPRPSWPERLSKETAAPTQAPGACRAWIPPDMAPSDK